MKRRQRQRRLRAAPALPTQWATYEDTGRQPAPYLQPPSLATAGFDSVWGPEDAPH